MKPDECPRCGSRDISVVDGETELTGMELECYCEDCEQWFTNYYEFVRRELHER
jgi:transcriptional regulator NrdR family protein